MGRKKIEVKPGDKYNRLTIIKEVNPYVSPKGEKKRKFLCQCDCGSEPIEVVLNSLRKGITTSCGCYNKEKVLESNKENKKKYNTFHINYRTGVVTGKTEDGKEFYSDVSDIKIVEEYYWNINDKGYVYTMDRKTHKKILMHRLIMNSPTDMVIDHIDHNKINNCKSNLRICSQKDNSRNLLISKNNTSGITGVIWNNENNKWRARITVNGKLIHLGYFETLEEAAKARYDAELLYFGTFSPNYEKLTQNESSQPSEQQNT